MSRRRFQLPITTDPLGWPSHLPVLAPKDFVHMTYGSNFWETDEEVKAQDALEYSNCGSQCCVVGWMTLAFRGNPDFSEVQDLPTPAEETFARAFLKAAGVTRKIIGKYPTAVRAMEACFEAFPEDPEDNGLPSPFSRRLTKKEAARCWTAALKACGYEVPR